MVRRSFAASATALAVLAIGIATLVSGSEYALGPALWLAGPVPGLIAIWGIVLATRAHWPAPRAATRWALGLGWVTLLLALVPTVPIVYFSIVFAIHPVA